MMPPREPSSRRKSLGDRLWVEPPRERPSRISRYRVAVSLSFALVMGLTLFLRRCDRHEDPPSSIYHSALSRHLRTVESLRLRALGPVEERGRALALFRAHVRTAGRPLQEDAVRHIVDGNAADRRRAQLVLAQAEPLPDELLQRLRDADRLSVWAYAQFLESPWDHFPERPTPPLPDFAHDPLRDVAPELRERLSIPEDELADYKPEFIENYRNEFAPKLEEIWKHVPPEERTVGDIDGDGIDELLVAADDIWDTWWMHDRRFVALLKRHAAQGRWSLVGFDRMDGGERILTFGFRDLDRDGRYEALVRSRVLGANHGTGTLCVFSRRRLGQPAVLRSGEPTHAVMILERSEQDPVVFATSEYYLPNWTGTALERVGVAARQIDLYTWKTRRFRKLDTIYIPL